LELEGIVTGERSVNLPWPFWKVMLARDALLVLSAESQVVGVTKVVFVMFAKVELKSKISDAKSSMLQLIIETPFELVMLNATPEPGPETVNPLQSNVTLLVFITNALLLVEILPVKVVLDETFNGNATRMVVF
jgi:hypothetical protein